MLMSGSSKSGRMLSCTAWYAGWFMPRWLSGRPGFRRKRCSQALDDRSEVGQAARSQIPASLAPASGLTLVEVRYDNLV